MKKRFEKYAQEGADLLRTHKRAKDGFYLDWKFYGSVRSSEGSWQSGLLVPAPKTSPAKSKLPDHKRTF
jgi:hypothetical protein